MADVGRSTSAHAAPASASGRNVDRWLRNWGAWLASLPPDAMLAIPISPMFRAYIAGYRLISPRRSPEDVDAAEGMDMLVATLTPPHVACLICHYVLELSSRRAARLLVELDAERTASARPGPALGCGRQTYLSRLDEAVDEVERRLTEICA